MKYIYFNLIHRRESRSSVTNRYRHTASTSAGTPFNTLLTPVPRGEMTDNSNYRIYKPSTARRRQHYDITVLEKFRSIHWDVITVTALSPAFAEIYSICTFWYRCPSVRILNSGNRLMIFWEHEQEVICKLKIQKSVMRRVSDYKEIISFLSLRTFCSLTSSMPPSIFLLPLLRQNEFPHSHFLPHFLAFVFRSAGMRY